MCYETPKLNVRQINSRVLRMSAVKMQFYLKYAM